MRSHIETLLQRDIRLIINTTATYDQLLALLQYLAKSQGQVFVLKDCSQAARLAQNIVKKLLEAFEGLFLIRKVMGVGFRTAPMYFLEDQGMAYYLTRDSKTNWMSRFIFSQLFSNGHYSHIDKNRISYYETKSGHSIIFCILI